MGWMSCRGVAYQHCKVNGLQPAKRELICIKAAFTRVTEQHVAGILCGQDVVEAQITMMRDSLLPGGSARCPQIG